MPRPSERPGHSYDGTFANNIRKNMESKMISRAARLMVAIALVSGAPAIRGQENLRVTAYYAGWLQGEKNSGYLPAQNIDFSALTHIVHFALVPGRDGSLNETGNSVTEYNANALTTRAHRAGKKVLVSVGGWGSEEAFRGATAPALRARFIAGLVALMKSRSYDGIDVDWEPLGPADAGQYTAFITELRSSLDRLSPRPMLTAATAWSAPVFAALKDAFDQINLMTYDLSGAWQGWVTWHNAPIYDGGLMFPGTSRTVPSSNAMVEEFLAAGVPAGKLAVGIDFYGYVWSGGTGMRSGGATVPRESWKEPPSVEANVPYYTIMEKYYQPQFLHWDSVAQAAYLSIDRGGSADDRFISFDNEQTCRRKIDYARSKGLGGVFIWELGGGYRASMPEGERDRLLGAVREAVTR